MCNHVIKVCIGCAKHNEWKKPCEAFDTYKNSVENKNRNLAQTSAVWLDMHAVKSPERYVISVECVYCNPCKAMAERPDESAAAVGNMRTVLDGLAGTFTVKSIDGTINGPYKKTVIGDDTTDTETDTDV